MSTAVRMAAYSGIRAIPWASNNQLATNAAYVMAEPPLATQAITATGTAQSSTSALSPTGSAILRIEVQKGQIVHYRVSRPNETAVAATTNDPTVDGKDNIDWGMGYLISLLEAGSEA